MRIISLQCTDQSDTDESVVLHRLTCFCLSLVRFPLTILCPSRAYPLLFSGIRPHHSYCQRTQRELAKQDERMDRSLGGREETKKRCENAKSCSLSRWELLVVCFGCVSLLLLLALPSIANEESSLPLLSFLSFFSLV